MQTSLIQDWTYALFTELNRYKGWAALLFLVTICAVVGTGFVWPKQYEASAIVFADDQNIIKPLLAGQAEVTRPDVVDQLTVVRQRLTSVQILEQVLLDTKMASDVSDSYKIQPLIRQLQGGILVTDAGRNHYRIAYRSPDPAVAYEMANAITNVFIRDSARIKRQESGEAFTFIDAQVKTYKEQLQTAEEKLKNFKSQNPLGSEDTARRRGELRQSIESLTLDLQVARARRDELRSQLTHESAYIAQSYKTGMYRDAISQAQSKLDTLRLSYQETYPDIVALKQQIQDMQKSIAQTESQQAKGPRDESSSAANPVYQRMKGDLSDAEVQVRTLEMRLASNQHLLEQAMADSRQGAEYQAQLAELTRDYNVTQQIYENMLERKERARLSMALDVQGQGLNYKIQEPPVYPTVPVGLRFMHFFVLAPVVGLAIPLALIVALVMLDPRFRFADGVQSSLPESVVMLAVIPHMTTTQDRRELRSEWRNVVMFMAVVLLVYALVGAARLLGLLG